MSSNDKTKLSTDLPLPNITYDFQYLVSLFVPSNYAYHVTFKFNSDKVNLIHIHDLSTDLYVIRGNYDQSQEPYILDAKPFIRPFNIIGWHKNTAPNPNEAWHQSPVKGELNDYGGSFSFEDDINWNFNSVSVTFRKI
ncbi:hypothetical protein [Bacillus cereus]|uniref:hypothetical protein n=1 Tax=Bacillus cereus TaxID=1396 RepID=UPI000BF7153C|nr:hypothetical protein [Bacillus cereus]PFD09190.1 hypothetical protein CN295_22935 [Bacillus cereus]